MLSRISLTEITNVNAGPIYKITLKETSRLMFDLGQYAFMEEINMIFYFLCESLCWKNYSLAKRTYKSNNQHMCINKLFPDFPF